MGRREPTLIHPGAKWKDSGAAPGPMPDVVVRHPIKRCPVDLRACPNRGANAALILLGRQFLLPAEAPAAMRMGFRVAGFLSRSCRKSRRLAIGSRLWFA